MQGLPKQRMELFFTKGLNQKLDPRMIDGPELVRAVDVDFDNLGGLRLRYPYASIGANVFGGGTISNTRRIVKCGDELLLFTKDTLYSWSSQTSTWVSRGTHLAIKVDEQPVFVTTGDQVEADRAELNGTIVYTWSDSTGVYAAAVDKSTRAVIMAPTLVPNWGDRSRVVALSTKILLFGKNGSLELAAYALDPASPSTALAGSETVIVSSATGFDAHYDVEKIPSADTAIFAARLNPATSYIIGKVTAGLSVSTSTKARTCDGPIAVACTADGTLAQVARGNGTNIQGDRITVSSLADAATGQALGSGTSTINQITAAYVDSTTCHVWWHSNQSTDSTDWDTDYNTVTVAGSIGSAARFLRRVGIASRAFAYNGQAYVWLVFSGESSFSGASPSKFRAQLQNTYFLYRHDGTLQSKAAFDHAAGLPSANGHLPGVVLTTGSTVFSWCGGVRRVVPIGSAAAGQSSYSDRGPSDIVFTFDSNDARRVAKLGPTLYLTGGEILQYDGRQLVECGFHLYPHYFGAIDAGGGSVATGTYALKISWRSDNARGDRDRSTSATVGEVAVTGSRISIPDWTPLYVTRKTNIVAEAWRTAVGPTADAPFFLITSQNPASTSNPNRYVPNDATASTLATLNDDFADATLTTKESHPENEGVLEFLAPPGATLIASSDTRLFLAGVAGDPHRVWYSRQRNDGEVASFHDALVVSVPEAGGDITGLAFFERTLIVFRETAAYALDGFGYDNTGGGQNYEARQICADVGAVSQESIVWTPMGLMFKTNKGWYLMKSPQLGGSVYVGGNVRNYDSETVHAATLVESTHQVRIVTSARVLMFDYLADAWAEWSISDGLHACMWNGTYHYLATASVKAEQSSYSTADYGWDVEMLIHPGSIQGFARIYRILVLGEVRGAGSIRFRLGGYEEGTYFDDKTWTISPTAAGKELEVKHGPSRQQQKVARLRLTSQTTAGEKPRLSAITIEYGIKGPTFRNLPAAQKQ